TRRTALQGLARPALRRTDLRRSLELAAARSARCVQPARRAAHERQHSRAPAARPGQRRRLPFAVRTLRRTPRHLRRRRRVQARCGRRLHRHLGTPDRGQRKGPCKRASAALTQSLQWGGRFGEAPDPALIAFGSSLGEDLVLAPFDVRCSHAHVVALADGNLIEPGAAAALHAALDAVKREIDGGEFFAFAGSETFEDVHGAIDARVRALTPPDIGEALHTGRSRNDQVATTLLLYARDRAEMGHALCTAIARAFLTRARGALERKTLLAATTHWQPAQPVLFAFWLHAAAQPFVRAAERFERVRADASRYCPLGSAAVSGSSLPLARAAAANYLGFAQPSSNALDTVGDRDVALDLLSAVTRAVIAATRPSEEFVIWSTPAFGYARLGRGRDRHADRRPRDDVRDRTLVPSRPARDQSPRHPRDRARPRGISGIRTGPGLPRL